MRKRVTRTTQRTKQRGDCAPNRPAPKSSVGQRFSRVAVVAARYKKTPSTIWRWARLYVRFPKPYAISPGATAWLDDELDQFDALDYEEKWQQEAA